MPVLQNDVQEILREENKPLVLDHYRGSDHYLYAMYDKNTFTGYCVSPDPLTFRGAFGDETETFYLVLQGNERDVYAAFDRGNAQYESDLNKIWA